MRKYYFGSRGQTKTPVIIAAAAIVTICIVAGMFYYGTHLPNSVDSNPEPNQPSTTPTSSAQLKISNIDASSNGTITLTISLYESDQSILKTIKINGTSYPWSEGSQENATILRDQTKTWTKNIGTLTANTTIAVTVEATNAQTTETATVKKSPTATIPDKPIIPTYFYDYHSCVGLFDRGIHVTATTENPLTQLPRSDLPQSYWKLMKENETNRANSKDFISIIVSRGDMTTGGYTIQAESFNQQEGYPTKLRFQANFTDPGKDVIVTQELTNPTMLVPIGQLSPGEYLIEVHITQYILTFDDQGQPIYRPLMTFREEVWTQTLTIAS
jgi:hypothetical protein